MVDGRDGGVAALGLRLVGAGAAGGSWAAMTAAVVVLAVGGSVTPTGDVTAFGAGVGVGAGDARAALDVMPWGVTLTGALVLGLVFLRSVRAGAGRGELAARAAVVGVLFTGTAGGPAWAGHDAVTLDGGRLPVPRVPVRVEVPGIGDIGGLLPDRVGDLVRTRARVGFSVDLGPTLLGAGLWVALVLAVALLASRRGPAACARLRPAVSAVVAMLVVAVGAEAPAPPRTPGPPAPAAPVHPSSPTGNPAPAEAAPPAGPAALKPRRREARGPSGPAGGARRGGKRRGAFRKWDGGPVRRVGKIR